jgi:8-oxo-dGTP pyrophosphatase MutT (NUDIX family)
MNLKNGPWTIKQRTKKYQSQLVEVYEDQVIKPSGQAGTYAMVRIAPGVSILAIDEDQNVYLVKEFRYAIGKESIAAVSGAIDDGEDPKIAARRELMEELGIEAEELIDLGIVESMPSIVDSPAFLFLAKNLTFKEQQTEGSEIIELQKMKLDEAIEMVLNGNIRHGTSCVLIFKAKAYLER